MPAFLYFSKIIDFNNLNPLQKSTWIDAFLFQHFYIVSFVALIVCLIFGAIIYSLFHDFIVRRRWSKPTNDILEISIGLLVLVLGQSMIAGLLQGILDRGGIAAGMIFVIFSSFFGGIIIIRIAITMFVSFLVVALLMKLSKHRALRSSAVFGAWDLFPITKKEIVRLILVIPLVFLAFYPIQVVFSLFWNLLLSKLNLDLELQDVVIDPFREGNLAIAVVFIMAITIVPIYEEILFRGALYRSLREKLGLIPGVLISAFIFAFFHHNMASFGPIMLLAVFLALSYEWTGSLWASIFLHSIFNCVSFSVMA